MRRWRFLSVVLAGMFGIGVVCHTPYRAAARAAQKKKAGQGKAKAPGAKTRAGAGQRSRGPLTDEQVVRAIERAQKWLMSQQGGNGAWKEATHHQAPTPCGHTEMALFSLVYTGIHPNREAISKGLDVLMGRSLAYTYAISMRAMAYAYLQRKLSGPRRDAVHKALISDAMWLVQAQGSHGGWNYTSLGGSGGRYDLSNTQMAMLALREAALAGVEIPRYVWERSMGLYRSLQKPDGAWNYGDNKSKKLGGNTPGYGTMTAAGLASIFITMDNLNLASGCPCRGGRSGRAGDDFERRVDAALGWLGKHFKPDVSPKHPSGTDKHKRYWLYSVERVGIAAGYKYFGTRNWYKEGATHLVRAQQGNGSWGGLPETCFCLLFLYKGRAPILYNKLQYEGEWNNHRRDIANLTTYIEKVKEQMFHWQIVSLRAPVEELHDAPVLYITAEKEPEFTDAHKKKLRQFTDTGGTILLEASCGNPAVRKWAQAFVREVWPQWQLKPLGPDHGSFTHPHPLKQRPEILGLNDGMRTFLFYAMDDISCSWQTKAYARRSYLFSWGINLFTYATDQSPLRAKLQVRQPKEKDRYPAAVRPGGRRSLRLVRVKYDGPGWLTGRNYRVFQRLTSHLNTKAGVSLTADEKGVKPSDLGGADVAYLIGPGEIAMAEAQKQALKAYAAQGGFLWVEAAGGSTDFNGAFRKLATEVGWQLKPIPQTHALMTGRLPRGAGYGLISGVQFSRSLRVMRLGRPHADLMGIYVGDKLAGVYSPFDIMFSMTGYNAYDRRGYKAQDARAVATNIILFVTGRRAA